MGWTIARALLERITAAASASPEEEICGLLLGEPGLIAAAPACRNVAAWPARRFEIDPVALLAAHRAARTGGPAMLGCYHSHPSGSPDPSPRDAADAAPDGSLWLILGRREARLWRAVQDGQVHARFDPVRLDVRSCCAGGAAGPKSAATSFRESP